MSLTPEDRAEILRLIEDVLSRKAPSGPSRVRFPEVGALLPLNWQPSEADVAWCKATWPDCPRSQMDKLTVEFVYDATKFKRIYDDPSLAWRMFVSNSPKRRRITPLGTGG